MTTYPVNYLIIKGYSLPHPGDAGGGPRQRPDRPLRAQAGYHIASGMPDEPTFIGQVEGSAGRFTLSLPRDRNSHDPLCRLSAGPWLALPRVGCPGVQHPQPLGGHRAGAAPWLAARAGVLVSGSEILPGGPHPAGGSLAGVRAATGDGDQWSPDLARGDDAVTEW